MSDEYNSVCIGCLHLLREETSNRRIITRFSESTHTCRGCGYKVSTKYTCTTKEIMTIREIFDSVPKPCPFCNCNVCKDKFDIILEDKCNGPTMHCIYTCPECNIHFMIVGTNYKDVVNKWNKRI